MSGHLQLSVFLFEGGLVVGQDPLLRHSSPTAIGLLYSRLMYSLQRDEKHGSNYHQHDMTHASCDPWACY